MAQLAIGTAQFGLDYGIRNKSGKIPLDKIREILDSCLKEGIDLIDTAQAYGESEEVLGKILSEMPGNKNLRIVSKISAENVNRISDSVKESCGRLMQENLYGMLYHDFSSFTKNRKTIEDLYRLREMGILGKIGFSLYYPHEALFLLENNIQLDIIQIPYNLFDRRFEPVLEPLKAKGVEIHIRSVFLQGLFFIPADELVPFFEPVKGKIALLQSLSHREGRSVSSLCMGFVSNNPYVDKIIIGVDSPENLRVNINAFSERYSMSELFPVLNEYQVSDEKIVLPFNWNLN